MPDLYEGASLEDEQMLDEVDEETQQRIDLGIKDDLEWLQKRKQAEIELNELDLKNLKEKHRKLSEEIIPSKMTELGMTSTTMLDGSKVDEKDLVFVHGGGWIGATRTKEAAFKL